MADYKVAIDAGHGGNDFGAVFNGRKEKDDVFRLAMEVGRILEESGVDVFYVRDDDIYETPFKKATDANNSGADLFVSLHRNSSERPNQYSGVETLVYEKGGTRNRLANNINSELEAVGFNNIGVSERPNLVVLRRTQMPAALVEVGFINNENDNRTFDQNFNAIAKGIADGILTTLYQRSAVVNSSNVNMPDGNMNIPGDSETTPNGNMNVPDNNMAMPDGSMNVPGGNAAMPNVGMNVPGGNAAIPNMGMNVPGGNMTMPDSGMNVPGRNMTGMPESMRTMPEENAVENNFDVDGRMLPEGCYTKWECDDENNADNNVERLYRVQVGAFRNKESADRMLNSLLIEGFPAFIVYDDGIYKVQVGAFRFLANAIKMEERLRRFRYNTYITT